MLKVALSLLMVCPACLSEQDADLSLDSVTPGEASVTEAHAPNDLARDGATASAADSADASDLGGGEEPDVDPVWDAEPTEGLVVVALEGVELRPLTDVHLSLAWPGREHEIDQVEWRVEGPDGPAAQLLPSAFAAAVVLTVNVVGAYRVTARVRDRDGAEHVARRLDLLVAPGSGLYIQLTWRTPGDLDETNTGGDQIYFSVGSDVDLHLRHPKAFGGYFDRSYDCYWDNVQPEWGIFGPADNPRLDRDDTDGGGPEVISLEEPELGVAYTVGVHFWNDWGYGNAFTTLRVYSDGALLDEWADVELENDDMWTALVIADGVVTRAGDGAPSIQPGYRGFATPTAGHLAIVSEQGEAAPQGSTFMAHVEAAADILADHVEWSLQAPDGALFAIAPAGPLVTQLTVEGVGLHTLRADVYDFEGAVMATLVHAFMVAPATDVAVELTWRTPDDPDETDLAFGKDARPAGSDLDLYLLHPRAQGDPRAAAWVCSWRLGGPSWGPYHGYTDPELIGDDFDGGGPERIELHALEPGEHYTVGVHYYRDSGYGPAYATLRVFVEGVLVGESLEVALEPSQFWRALTLSDTTVEPIGETPDIAPLVLP